MEGNIADVRCRECGAPAKYNVIRQQYLCSYCGGKTEVSEAIAEKKGFRSIIHRRRTGKEDIPLLQCLGVEEEARRVPVLCAGVVRRRKDMV